MKRGQNTLSSVIIIGLVLFICLIPLNMLVQGTAQTYGVPNAENFTFASQTGVINKTQAMTNTILNQPPSEGNQVLSTINVVLTGALSSVQVVLGGVSTFAGLITDVFNIQALKSLDSGIKSGILTLFGAIVMLGCVAAYLRWRI